jgi:hypothetical protein
VLSSTCRWHGPLPRICGSFDSLQGSYNEHSFIIHHSSSEKITHYSIIFAEFPCSWALICSLDSRYTRSEVRAGNGRVYVLRARTLPSQDSRTRFGNISCLIPSTEQCCTTSDGYLNTGFPNASRAPRNIAAHVPMRPANMFSCVYIHGLAKLYAIHEVGSMQSCGLVILVR